MNSCWFRIIILNVYTHFSTPYILTHYFSRSNSQSLFLYCTNRLLWFISIASSYAFCFILQSITITYLKLLNNLHKLHLLSQQTLFHRHFKLNLQFKNSHLVFIFSTFIPPSTKAPSKNRYPQKSGGLAWVSAISICTFVPDGFLNSRARHFSALIRQRPLTAFSSDCGR